MHQRDTAILKNSKLYVELQEANKQLAELDQQRSGAMEVVQSVAPPPDALPQPCGMNAVPGSPKAPALAAPLPST